MDSSQLGAQLSRWVRLAPSADRYLFPHSSDADAGRAARYSKRRAMKAEALKPRTGGDMQQVLKHGNMIVKVQVSKQIKQASSSILSERYSSHMASQRQASRRISILCYRILTTMTTSILSPLPLLVNRIQLALLTSEQPKGLGRQPIGSRQNHACKQNMARCIAVAIVLVVRRLWSASTGPTCCLSTKLCS